jgi:hypothetical protein
MGASTSSHGRKRLLAALLAARWAQPALANGAQRVDSDEAVAGHPGLGYRDLVRLAGATGALKRLEYFNERLFKERGRPACDRLRF